MGCGAREPCRRTEKLYAQLHNGNRRVGCIPDEKIFSKCPPRHVGVFPFFYFEEIKERISQGCEGFSPRNLRRLRWFLRKVSALLYLIKLSCGLKPWSPAKLRLFILSFCRSVKESIKESASERRQELPAGTGAAPLCQPLKLGVDYRDVTAALKMKHSRRFRGERFTFLAVDVMFRQRLQRERGLSAVNPRFK